MTVIKKNKTEGLFFVVFAVNFLLFAAKLYVGLSSNSISIYSDGINNLFDSLSGLLSAVCLLAVSASVGFLQKAKQEKTEQFLSFVLSVLISFAGIMFFYNSLERLMYPTPVWFTWKYFFILCVTAGVKLLLFLFYRAAARKKQSDIMKLIAIDSRNDFFITLASVLAIAFSQLGTFSADAFFGIAISVFMLVTGIRMTALRAKKLMNQPERSVGEKITEILHSFGLHEQDTQITFVAGNPSCLYLQTNVALQQQELEALKEQILQQTGTLVLVIQ